MLPEATDSGRFFCPEAVLLLGVPVLDAGRDCLLGAEEVAEVAMDDASLVDALLGMLRWRGRGVATERSCGLGVETGRCGVETERCGVEAARGVQPRARLALLPLTLELSETWLAPLLETGLAGMPRRFGVVAE